MAEFETMSLQTCKLCGRQYAKYNCPTCNVPYCSLVCFRSESHSRCSETFYKKEIELDIQIGPSRTPQERLRMMKLLQKFEEESGPNQQTSLESEHEDDGGDLARRFQDVNLDSSPVTELWSKLTPEEQARFLKIMENPTGKLTQQLLASEELENEQRKPWWEASLVELDSTPGLCQQFGMKPDIMQVPTSMVKPTLDGSPFLYNMCAICIAYSYTTRHLSTSPLSSLTPADADFQESRRLISQFVPFVTDRRSTTLYSRISSLTTDIWSRFEPGEMNSELFALLLRDAASLIRPLPVTTISTDHTSPTEINLASHPYLNVILVLSDLTALFKASPHDKRNKSNHIAHKLLFYAAHILSTPFQALQALAEELLDRSLKYQTDGGCDDQR